MIKGTDPYAELNDDTVLVLITEIKGDFHTVHVTSVSGEEFDFTDVVRKIE